MKYVVFVPGIMGSELRLRSTDEIVWPPTIVEASIGGYKRINKLMDPDLYASTPIVSVGGFVSVYRSILNDIRDCGYSSSGANDRKLISFPYDWRRSNLVTADALADLLDQHGDFEELILIGHSMGGLVLRLLLESGKYQNRRWFNSITKLITYGTPHNGAAAALVQVTTGEKCMGVEAADIKRLASDSRYPSAYQLVPPAGTALTTTAAGADELPLAMDSFDPEIINRFGLNQENIDAAREQWAALDINQKPADVEYFWVVGSALKTKYRNNWNGVELQTLKRQDSGDGTVPISSAVNVTIPHIFSLKKHAAIFEDRDTRFALYRMLDAPMAVRPMSAEPFAEVRNPDALGLSVDQDSYDPHESIGVVVSYVTAQTDPSLTLRISRLDEESEDGDIQEDVGDPIHVSFQGTSVEHFTFSIDADLQPGVYELRTDSLRDDPERTLFMVSP